MVKGEEKPRIISKEYTLSLSDKATLRRDLESWRGQRFSDDDIYVVGFDLQNILGKPCQITVGHNTSKTGKTYADIAGIVRFRRKRRLQAPAETLFISRSTKTPTFR